MVRRGTYGLNRIDVQGLPHVVVAARSVDHKHMVGKIARRADQIRGQRQCGRCVVRTGDINDVSDAHWMVDSVAADLSVIKPGARLAFGVFIEQFGDIHGGVLGQATGHDAARAVSAVAEFLLEK